MSNRYASWFVISSFVLLYLVVSIISTIHVIDFFMLSNPKWLAISLAISFEIGAAASLASLVVLEKMNKTVVWILFIVLTLMQAMGNMYYSYHHANNYEQWMELFGLIEEEPIYQKRILSFISGAILPLVSLGFIKSLVDYIRPDESKIPIDDNTGSDDIIEEEQEPHGNEDEVITNARMEDRFSDPTRIK